MDKDHPVPKKVKMCPQSTKKLDCPAMVKVSRRILFDDVVVSECSSCIVNQSTRYCQHHHLRSKKYVLAFSSVLTCLGFPA